MEPHECCECVARQRPVIDASLHWYTADPDTTEQDEANDALLFALADYRDGGGTDDAR
jgi:hypothetical protein